jgi:hypothetical protein
MTKKSLLSTLTLIEKPIRTTDPVIQRQNKLIARIEVQIEMAKCFAEHKEYSAFHMKTVTDPEGNKTKVSVPKQIKKWFYQENNKFYTTIRYGAKTLFIDKSMQVIVVDDIDALIAAYELIVVEIKGGSFNSQLQSAATKVGKQ